jgi:hypothetical protein
MVRLDLSGRRNYILRKQSFMDLPLFQTRRTVEHFCGSLADWSPARKLSCSNIVEGLLRACNRSWPKDGITGMNQPGLSDVPITLWTGTKRPTPRRRERRQGQQDREGQFQYCRPPCILPMSHIAEPERRMHRRWPAGYPRLQQIQPKASSIQRVAHDESNVDVDIGRFRKLHRLGGPGC